MRTTRKQLDSMTNILKQMLRDRGDVDADFIELEEGTYGYYLAVFPDGPTHGYSNSRFGDTQHKPGEMWECLRLMQRALEGVPQVSEQERRAAGRQTAEWLKGNVPAPGYQP